MQQLRQNTSRQFDVRVGFEGTKPQAGQLAGSLHWPDGSIGTTQKPATGTDESGRLIQKCP